MQREGVVKVSQLTHLAIRERMQLEGVVKALVAAIVAQAVQPPTPPSRHVLKS
jgi:N-acetylglutamate synthase-like GNAT family acetyltransferase